MARYSDEERTQAKALSAAIDAAEAALDKFEEENGERLTALDAEFEQKRLDLNDRFEQEAKALDERHQAEAEAFEAEVQKARGMADIAAAADAAFDALQNAGLPEIKRFNGRPVYCATSGKVIFRDDDVVYRDGKVHLAGEVTETVAA